MMTSMATVQSSTSSDFVKGADVGFLLGQGMRTDITNKHFYRYD